MLQNNGKRKRGRKPVFNASQFYPWRYELEMKELVESMLRENGKRFKELALIGYQADGLDDVNGSDIFVPSNLEEKANSLFNGVNDFASRKMDDFAEKTVGRSIGYIPNQSKIREDFVSAFVANCKSAAEDQKKDIANAVYRSRMFPDGKKEGLVKEINEINEKYTAKKAKFIARNETGNLNAAVQRSQMEGAGFEMYTWMSMPDGVTRDTHRAMNGLVCRWDDPNVYSDDGGKTWHERKGSMFIGQPGQDYNCRCTAVPFDPELDEDYSVKEMPEEEPEEKEPTPLEQAMEETKAAVERAEKAEIEKVAAEKKIESLEKTNEKYYDNLVSMRETASVNLVNAKFPDEVWEKENGINISIARKLEAESGNEPEKLEKEKFISRILVNKGHSVWLIPEKKNMNLGGRRPDAIVDGLFAEMKLVTGQRKKIWDRLIYATTQSKDYVFIATEKKYSVQDVINTIKGKFMKALSDNPKYAYPFEFEDFFFIISDKEIHRINLIEIWKSAKIKGASK